MVGHIFLSYSRREFYFAEALVNRLSRAGVDVWFDAERLQPGLDWSTTIKQSLRGASAFVLIASRAALRSRYVQEEWLRAFAASKPIHIVVFEPVELPPELQEAASILVFRGDLPALVERLARVLQSGQRPHDPMPKPRPFGLPAYLPRDVFLVLLSLLGSAALIAAPALGPLIDVAPALFSNWPTAFVVLSALVGGALSYTLVAGPLLYQSWRLLRRTVSYYHLRFMLPLVPFIAGVIYLPSWGIRRIALEQGTSISPWVFLPLLLAVTVLNFRVFFGLTRSSESVFYWLPTGEAPETLRERYRVAPVRAQGTSLQVRTVSFRLHYADADRQIADDIRASMYRSDRELAIGAPGQPDYDILVVSNKTPVELIERVLTASPKLISIIASRVQMPERLSRLASYQWVDYRKRSSKQLDSLAHYMRRADPGPLPPNLRALPESLTKTVVPPRVFALANITRVSLGMYLLISVFGLYMVATNGGLDQLRTIQYASQIALMLFLCLDIWMLSALLDRRISYEFFMAVIIGSALFDALTVIFEGAQLGELIMRLVLLAAGVYVYNRFFYRYTAAWLPRRASRTRQPTLAAKGLLGASFRDVMVFCISVALVFVGILSLFTFSIGIFTGTVATFPGALALDATPREPDGRPKQIYVMEGSTVNARWLTTVPYDAYAPKWSPDRRGLAFLADIPQGEDDLYVVEREGGEARLIAHEVLSFAWSPDGGRIALTQARGDEARVYLSDVGRPGLRHLADLPNAAELHLSWSPDGSTIAFYHEPSIYLVNSDGANLRRFASPRPAPKGIWYEDALTLAWSPEADRLVYGDGGDLVVASVREPSQRRAIAHLEGGYDAIASIQWSPDGQRIAYVASRSFRDAQLYTVRPDGSDPQRVYASDRFGLASVAWAPDGRSLAMIDGWNVVLVRADGSRARRLVLPVEFDVGKTTLTW